MRNIHGKWIPNISDYVYYKTISGVFPARVVSVSNPNSFNPIVTIEGHIAIHEGKHMEIELSELRNYPRDWN